MKSLEQIRDNEYAHISNKNLSEGNVKKQISRKADLSDMPAMLMFKRVTYRIYPGNQIVALYYSRMIDKYLSIPLGKDGILQVSEGVLYESLDEDWQAIVSNNIESTLNENIEKEIHNWNCDTSFRQKISQLREAADAERERLGLKQDYGWKENVPGYVDQKKAAAQWSKGEYSSAIKSGAKSLAKKAATGLALYAAGTALPTVARLAAASAATKDSSSKEKKSPTTGKTGDVSVPQIKTRSTLLSKQKQVQENKILDIREMVNNNINSKDLIINGRSVTINNSMAKRIIEVYDSVNVKNKKIVESMLNEDLESFKRLINFTIRN